MKKIALLAASSLIAVLTGNAIAQQSDDELFRNADENKDNVVSMAEAMGVFPTLTQQLFDQADENKGGVLTAAEYRALLGLTAGLAQNGSSSSSASSSGESSSLSSSSSSSSASAQ